MFLVVAAAQVVGVHPALIPNCGRQIFNPGAKSITGMGAAAAGRRVVECVAP